MFQWINDGLFAVLSWIQSWAGSWAIAIIIFTIMVRTALTPLDIKSRASMRKTQKLQPQLAALPLLEPGGQIILETRAENRYPELEAWGLVLKREKVYKNNKHIFMMRREDIHGG